MSLAVFSPRSAARLSPRESTTLPGELHLCHSPHHSPRNSPHHKDHDRPHDSPRNSDQTFRSSSGRPLPSPLSPRASPLSHQHLYVLPVLLLEFLALALTRAVLPGMLLQQYGSATYLVLGCADCVRGLLAFVACPLFGKLSDQWGRRVCLLITVMGTCAPVCSLALFPWKTPSSSTTMAMAMATDMEYQLPPLAIPVFVLLLCVSGIFSSTFTLVFAYISDTIPHREERVSAYGLALATFGLSFTIGPMAGGYLAKTNTHYVFLTSFLLTILDVFYIWFVLPESKQNSSEVSVTSIQQQLTTWHPLDAIRMVSRDPFLRNVGQVAFFYYTGLWAVISTLSLYAVQHFHLGPERLGELMSAFGLCTMIAEAVLVRILVPLWGETKSICVGLLSFSMQCIVLGVAYETWHLFICVAFSLLGNLVYPSLSSLVSSTVEPKRVGEALGALNGVKALTEGIGPLCFGALMTISEQSDFPGWPYWIAALLVLVAYDVADRTLPKDDEYIHELEFKQRRTQPTKENGCLSSPIAGRTLEDDEEEYLDLLPLSEVEESEEEEASLFATFPL